MTDSDQVKVSVLLEDKTINKYAAQALIRMANNSSSEITLLVINSETQSKSEGTFIRPLQSGVELIRKHGLWFPIIAKRALRPPPYAKQVHVDEIDCLSSADKVEANTIPANGLGNKLPEPVVDKIARDSDIVVRFGFGIIKGEILSKPKFGVLSFHHGDIRKYRGRAGGFWAYINNDPVAGVTLQRLNESLDGGEIAIYKSVDIDDANTLGEIRRRTHNASKNMLAEAINDINNGEFNPSEPDHLGKIYTKRSAQDVMTYWRKTLVGHMKNILG